MDQVIIENGIEIEVTDKEYLYYMRNNKKPMNWQIIEKLEDV